MQDFMSQVLSDKRTFLQTDALREMSEETSYAAFHAQVQELVTQGVLQPVGGRGDTNGQIPPLQRKYRIIRPKADLQAETEEIMFLSPRLHISSYLKNRRRYRRERDILLPLSTFLKREQDALLFPMSKNERAYAVWGAEKALDDSRYQGVIQYNDLQGLLNYYHTPEPFFDYLCMEVRHKTLLILENKDIWYTMRKIFLQDPARRRLFGLRLDGLIYGEGKKAARPGALTEYAASFQEELEFWYCGDIDYEGFSIYEAVRRANPSLHLRLFAPGYHAMVERGTAHGLNACPKEQERPGGLEETLAECFPQDRAPIADLLARGAYIPQECLNYPFLMEAMEP